MTTAFPELVSQCDKGRPFVFDPGDQRYRPRVPGDDPGQLQIAQRVAVPNLELSRFPVSQQPAVTELVAQQRSSSLTVSCSILLSLRCSNLLNSCRSEPQRLNQRPEHFPVAVSTLRAVSLHVQRSACVSLLDCQELLPAAAESRWGADQLGPAGQVFWLSVN